MKNQPGFRNFFLIAGPCVVENEKMPFEIAGTDREDHDRLEIPFIFKASYKKANRSRLDSFTGIGDEKALESDPGGREKFDIPVLTDIHTERRPSMAAVLCGCPADPCISLPADRIAGRCRQNRENRQYQKRTVCICRIHEICS